MKDRSRIFVKNQKGSTFVSVLVIISFVMVLGSVILAVSFQNVRRKQIEYASQKNFYEDEQGLWDIYNGIGLEVSECLAKAYHDTLTQVTAEKKGYMTQNAAYQNFAMLFRTRLENLYGEADTYEEETLNKLKGYVTVREDIQVEVLGYDRCRIEKQNEIFSRYILENVTVRYSKGEYETNLSTNIVIEVPYIQFYQDFSRILDYSLVGNQGIYIKNGSRQISGNIYAGTDQKTANAAYQGYQYQTNAVYDGLNIYKADVTFQDTSYLVSRGDINLCEADVTIGSSTDEASAVQLWAENIRTVESGRAGALISKKEEPAKTSLWANAEIYLANDLELNARNSSVTLLGDYYGYNYNSIASGINQAYETQEKENINDIYVIGENGQALHASSSAIIMNAANTSLNLEGLNTLVVAGLSYLDIRKPDTAYQAAGGGAAEYQTGESLGIRYQQFLYLAPDEILYEPNPSRGGTTAIEEVCPKLGDEKSKLTDWFAYTYLSEENPVWPVIYEMNGISYTYYFLNFKGEESKRAYVEEVLAAQEPADKETAHAYEKQRWEQKEEILQKAANADITTQIGVSGENCRIYTRGAMTDTIKGGTIENTEGLPSIYKNSLNMARHYVYLWKTLDPAQNYSMVSSTLSLEELQSELGRLSIEENTLPAGYYVDFSKIINDYTNEINGCEVMIKNGELRLDRNVKGIFLCKGDVVIEGSVEGIVIASGKITVQGNGSIKANRAILQTILETEQREADSVARESRTITFLSKYASYYFRQGESADTYLTDKDYEYQDNTKRVTGTKYTDYIYYENWQKKG